MGSRNTWKQFVVNAAGEPATGLSPSFGFYKKSTNGGAFADATPPSIAELGTSGIYEVNPALAAGEAVVGVISFGDTYTPSLVQVEGRYEDTVTPASFGEGSEEVTLSITVDGGAMPGVRVEVRNSGTLVAQRYSDASGEVTFFLDAGTYEVRSVRAGSTFEAVAITVADDAATPDAIDGAATPSDSTTPPGLTGTASYTAPTYDGVIGPLAARDSWAAARTVTDLPANISSAKFTVADRGSTGSLVTNTLTVTDAVAPTGALSVAIAPDALELPAGTYDYDFEVTLANGAVRTVEKGAFIVVGHPTP